MQLPDQAPSLWQHRDCHFHSFCKCTSSVLGGVNTIISCGICNCHFVSASNRTSCKKVCSMCWVGLQMFCWCWWWWLWLWRWRRQGQGGGGGTSWKIDVHWCSLMTKIKKSKNGCRPGPCNDLKWAGGVSFDLALWHLQLAVIQTFRT